MLSLHPMLLFRLHILISLKKLLLFLDLLIHVRFVSILLFVVLLHTSQLKLVGEGDNGVPIS